MFDFLLLANARLTLALNHWLATNPSFYEVALQLTGKISKILVLATFALLWFWPQPRHRKHLLLYPDMKMPALQAHWLNTVSREESRAQFLVLTASGVLGYMLSQLMAQALMINRPFASFLLVKPGVAGAFDSLQTYASFPSAPAAMLAAIPVALLFWDRRLTFIWAPLSALLMLAYVGLGFHWPTDMIAGALLGGVLTYAALWLYHVPGPFKRFFLILARGFELSATPYCYILYALLLLGIVEFILDFQHLDQALLAVRAEVLGRFASR